MPIGCKKWTCSGEVVFRSPSFEVKWFRKQIELVHTNNLPMEAIMPLHSSHSLGPAFVAEQFIQASSHHSKAHSFPTTFCSISNGKRKALEISTTIQDFIPSDLPSPI
jgi:hypothetical protein